MRTISTIVLVLTFVFSMAQDQEYEAKSTIKQVTVFLEGAQVARHTQVAIKPGTSIIKLIGVSHRINEQSIQVESTSPLKILSVSFHVNYLTELKKPEKIASLESERRKLLASVAQEHALEDVYKEEELILKTNRSIGGTYKGVEIEELKVAMDYFRQRLTDIKQLLLQCDRNIRKYNEELGKLEAQLKELTNQKEKPTGEIVIKVSTKSHIQATLLVKYLVQEAKWHPSYDIRAKDVQSPVSITYKANITQHSGEDWQDVALTISSANPSQVGAKPVIKPWYLGFNNSVSNNYKPTIATIPSSGLYGASNNLVRGRVTDSEGQGLPGVNVVIKGTTVGTVTDAEGFYSLTLTSDANTIVFSFIGYVTQEAQLANQPVIDMAMYNDVQQLQEVVVTAYGIQAQRSMTSSSISTSYTPKVKKVITATEVVRQTAVEFTLEDPFTVLSDGEMRTTDMIAYELPAVFEYYCVPKLETDAFLIAKVLEWDEYNFLEGEASLFFEGKYIGKSIMDTRNTSDTLTLSLGRDPNVLVTREKLKELSSKQFIGSNQKASFAYLISIRNKKNQPISIVIEDQIPVPNTKEISVDKVEDSKAEHKDDTGLLTWRREVGPGKTDNINLRYVVRFPKQSQMLLE